MLKKLINKLRGKKEEKFTYDTKWDVYRPYTPPESSSNSLLLPMLVDEMTSGTEPSYQYSSLSERWPSGGTFDGAGASADWASETQAYSAPSESYSPSSDSLTCE